MNHSVAIPVEHLLPAHPASSRPYRKQPRRPNSARAPVANDLGPETQRELPKK